MCAGCSNAQQFGQQRTGTTPREPRSVPLELPQRNKAGKVTTHIVKDDQGFYIKESGARIR